MSFWNYDATHFMSSAPNIGLLPVDEGIEVAFVGRSNTGKSSVINTLTNKKNLAFTSRTPGRTQLINLFQVANSVRLVDLPGYGYAQAPKEIRYKWQQALVEYLKQRVCLKGLVLLIDIRHPIRELDQKMIELIVQRQIPILILLSKADKLASGARRNQLNKMREVTKLYSDIQVELFSSLRKIGVEQLRIKLNCWFKPVKSKL